MEDKVNLGPLAIERVSKRQYTFFSVGEEEKGTTLGGKDQVSNPLLLPRFVMEYITDNRSVVKDLLSSLRKESLELIIQYQFGFKQIMS